MKNTHFFLLASCSPETESFSPRAFGCEATKAPMGTLRRMSRFRPSFVAVLCVSNVAELAHFFNGLSAASPIKPSRCMEHSTS